jgi:hypothetical protein
VNKEAFFFFLFSLLGAVAVVAGLYVVLWDKAEDARKQGRAPEDSTDRAARSDAQLDVEHTLAAHLLAGAARTTVNALVYFNSIMK